MMQQRLFILLFLTGFIPLFLAVPRKYYLIKPGKTWSEARAYCQATHADLAIMESNENMVQLQIETQIQQFSSSAWIGLYNDLHSWRWSMGNEPLGSTAFWGSGQPNNLNNNQDYVGTGPGDWNDLGNTDMRPFVCFDGKEQHMFIILSVWKVVIKTL
ncbi:hepatic lectin-like [Neoarius graeffei]|uniref:hepatic lectin-like n=1 Tax=Neoarius graeffei TaxID=443677 RepID=UPI00298CAC63|nr:hepatic lectin-like [Neoarius graeffei]